MRACHTPIGAVTHCRYANVRFVSGTPPTPRVRTQVSCMASDAPRCERVPQPAPVADEGRNAFVAGAYVSEILAALSFRYCTSCLSITLNFPCALFVEANNLWIRMLRHECTDIKFSHFQLWIICCYAVLYPDDHYPEAYYTCPGTFGLCDCFLTAFV